jgi:hypothetical protein
MHVHLSVRAYVCARESVDHITSTAADTTHTCEAPQAAHHSNASKAKNPTIVNALPCNIRTIFARKQGDEKVLRSLVERCF